jgi:hypothetical protein
MTMMSMRTLNNGTDVQKDIEDDLKSEAITEEIQVQFAPKTVATKQYQGHRDDSRNQYTPNEEHNQTIE